MSVARDSISEHPGTDDVLLGISRIAPEVAAGYEQIRGVIAEDGALSAARKALLVAVCATARGYDEMASQELDRGRSLGLGDREIGIAAVALLLARGEQLTGRFVGIAGGLSAPDASIERSDMPRTRRATGAAVRMAMLSTSVGVAFVPFISSARASSGPPPAAGPPPRERLGFRPTKGVLRPITTDPCLPA